MAKFCQETREAQEGKAEVERKLGLLQKDNSQFKMKYHDSMKSIAYMKQIADKYITQTKSLESERDK